MSKRKRVKRVEELVQRVISEKLITEVDLPMIERVTVTNVDMSADLKNAKVYFSIIATSEDEKDTIFKTILDRKKEIRFILGREVDLRFVPALDFRIDDTAERAARIERLINKIHEEKKE